MDPKDLNAGPDLQLYERVPIQSEVPDSRKIKVPIEKQRYRYGTAQRKMRYYTRQN